MYVRVKVGGAKRQDNVHTKYFYTSRHFTFLNRIK